MTFSVITEAEAEADWNRAVDWYEQCEPGLGLRFNDEIQALLQTLSRQPERFPLAGRLTQKARMIGWPYSIYFTVNTEHREVKVLAIWHGRRNPVELRRRVK